MQLADQFRALGAGMSLSVSRYACISEPCWDSVSCLERQLRAQVKEVFVHILYSNMYSGGIPEGICSHTIWCNPAKMRVPFCTVHNVVTAGGLLLALPRKVACL